MKKFLAILVLNLSVSYLFGMEQKEDETHWAQPRKLYYDDSKDLSDDSGEKYDFNVYDQHGEYQEDLPQNESDASDKTSEQEDSETWKYASSARTSRFKKWQLEEQGIDVLGWQLKREVADYVKNIGLFITILDEYISLSKPAAREEEQLQDFKKKWECEKESFEAWAKGVSYHELNDDVAKSDARLYGNFKEFTKAIRALK